MRREGDNVLVTPGERRAVLATTIAALGVALAYGWLWARDATLELLALLPITFSSAGKLLPLWGLSEDSSFGPYQLAVVVWVRDTIEAVIVVYAFDALARVGTIGRLVDKLRARAVHIIAKRPLLHGVSISGIALFVFVPLPGTGAIAGSLVGSLLGMHRVAVIVAVAAGSLAGAMSIAIAALHFDHAVSWVLRAHSDPAYRYPIICSLLAVAAGALALVWWRHRPGRTL